MISLSRKFMVESLTERFENRENQVTGGLVDFLKRGVLKSRDCLNVLL